MKSGGGGFFPRRKCRVLTAKIPRPNPSSGGRHIPHFLAILGDLSQGPEDQPGTDDQRSEKESLKFHGLSPWPALSGCQAELGSSAAIKSLTARMTSADRSVGAL